MSAWTTSAYTMPLALGFKCNIVNFHLLFTDPGILFFLCFFFFLFVFFFGTQYTLSGLC